jgi:hypothetical protein
MFWIVLVVGLLLTVITGSWIVLGLTVAAALGCAVVFG